MFLSLIGAALAFGTAALGAAVYSDGAFIALQTAAQVIGWLLALATLGSLAGLREAHPGQIGASLVTVLSAGTLLYMSYFLDWSRREAVAETLAVLPGEPKVVEQKFAAVPPVDIPVIRTVKPKVVDSCSALSGVEALQCRRCGDKSSLAWVACHEQVRLDYCESGAGDERTCPSPIPQSYPG